MYEVSVKPPCATCPALRVTVLTSVLSVKMMLKATLARAERTDLGVYPIFLANATTFSLNVALSRNTSFTVMFVLNAVMYELYANKSIKTEKLDPSKSKSVKSLLDLR